MYELIAMALALVLLVVLLRLKVRIGRSMVVVAIVLAMLLGVTPGEFGRALVNEWYNKPLSQTTPCLFVMLTTLIMAVNVFAIAMRETGVSQRLVPALQGLFRSRRLALVAIPMMMGMLPTPAGIMLSAPMVRDLGDHIGVERGRLATINFFFRHQWEPVWPLYPAVPLVQGIFGVSAFTLISHNMAITLAALLGGVIFLLLWGIPERDENSRSQGRFVNNVRDFAHAFWPIVLVAALYAGVNFPPAVGMSLAIIVFLAIHKVAPNRWVPIFKSGVEFDFSLLIFGALLFKLDLEAGGAVEAVVKFFSDINMPELLVVFLLPLVVAYLTGVTAATVAITFPLLVPFVGTGPQARMGLETLAFSGLACGLLVTPVHLCLTLSASYFKTSLAGIILKMLVPIVFIALAGILMALSCG